MAKAKQNKGSQFSIEMDFKGMVVMMILAILTGATIFYLGVIFGKASRSPHEALRLTEETGAPAQGQTPKDLKIYDLGTTSPAPSSLQQEFEALKSQSDQVIDAEKKDAADKETIPNRFGAKERPQAKPTPAPRPKPAAAPAPAPAPATGAKAPGISWPEVAKETSDKKGDLYTIQILTTRQKSKAASIVNQLKAKGFDSYSEEIKLNDTLLYRVRVAKEPRSKIKAIRQRLSGAVEGLGKLQVLKVR